MTEINPSALRSLRDRKKLSLDDLAAKAKVDRGTISKIETGKRLNPRATTVRKLADALGVEPDALSSTTYDETELSPLSPKSQMNVRMANDARNALRLTAMRYGVTQSHILHLAPLLFRWAAEQSLEWRRARLSEIEARIDALANAPAPKHLSGSLCDHMNGWEVLEDERRSINRRDLFGVLLKDESLGYNYHEEEQNPMVQFLKTVAETLGDDVDFDHWSPRWGPPDYQLGYQEALELVGGDERAAHKVVSGFAPLHELPKEVREQGAPAVAEWAIETGDTELRKLIDIDALNFELGLEDD